MIPTDEQLWEKLRTIKPPYPVAFKFKSGKKITLCPPGNAEGIDIQSEVVRPKILHFRLYQGVGAHHEEIRIKSGVMLWWQEAYVYRLEMNCAITRAIESLDRLFAPVPRKPGHPKNDNTPWPEDFGQDIEKMTNQIMIEAIEGWICETEKFLSVRSVKRLREYTGPATVFANAVAADTENQCGFSIDTE